MSNRKLSPLSVFLKANQTSLDLLQRMVEKLEGQLSEASTVDFGDRETHRLGWGDAVEAQRLEGLLQPISDLLFSEGEYAPENDRVPLVVPHRR